MRVVDGVRTPRIPLSAFVAQFTVAAALATAASATTITVTSTGDAIAIDGLVTLREAITAANSNLPSGDAPAGSAGLDVIEFNISGLPGTVHTISPNNSLPTITDQLRIDGYSQLGASPNTLTNGTDAFLAIELDGTNAGFSAGLVVSAGRSTVKGLVINRFNSEGIFVNGASCVISGNFIGTDPSGNFDRGNGVSGVALLGTANRVGGTAPADRNLISGNDFAGVTVQSASAIRNHIEGNLIGTDDGGTSAIENGGAGVYLVNGADNVVGGTEAGAGNVIAFNKGAGIRLGNTAGIGNSLLDNSIFSNDGLGIDFYNDGITQNDAPDNLDGDSGPNGLQNFPTLTAAEATNPGVHILGSLDSAANTEFRIELFSSAACDASGNGQGRTFLGAESVTTASSGHAAIDFNLGASVSIGDVISATATQPNSSTSEFSPCQTIVVAPTPTRTPTGLATPTMTPGLVSVAPMNRRGSEVSIGLALSALVLLRRRRRLPQ